MTVSTLSNLPLMVGGAVASSLGRAGAWTFARYMRAPLASTGLLAMVTMTALAGSNALYFQTHRHPAPFFGQPGDMPQPALAPEAVPTPAAAPAQLRAVPALVENQTTGSVAAPVVQAVPDRPVGNKQAFEVQKKLSELGLFDGKVDGFYGPMTARAIRTFEERNGMEPSGALTPANVDAILRADDAGRVPLAQAPTIIEPTSHPMQQAVATPQPIAPLVPKQMTLTPVDNAVDTVGIAAEQTIDSIVAAVGGSRGTPVAQASAPVPALPMLAASAQAMPAPLQVASLEPMVPAAAPMAPLQPTPVANQSVAQTSTLNPTNNIQLVTQIQRGLASLGFYHGSIDGHPGDGTAKAIREFENFHSYKVTGEIKPDLVGLLRDAGAAV